MFFDDNSLSDIAKAFFDDGVSNGEKISSPDDKRVLYRTIRAQYVAIEGFLALFSAKANHSPEKIECRKGCEWCCHQTVFALNYEIEYLFKWLKFALTKDELAALALRVKAKRDATVGLKEDELLKHRHACPLLIDGICSAYEARPMACRIYLSSSEKSCKDSIEQVPDTEPKLFQLPLRCGQMMNEGFTSSIHNKTYDVEEKTIEEGLYPYLEQYIKD